MNIWLVDWYIPVLMEGNKFWFYAICISIARTLAEFWMGESKRKKTESKLLLERLLVDLCDLTLPGSFLGWIPLGDFGVGVAMVVSTIVASREMWVRAGWVG